MEAQQNILGLGPKAVQSRNPTLKIVTVGDIWHANTSPKHATATSTLKHELLYY